MESSGDTHEVEIGVSKFIEWIRSGKLIVRAYPSQNIHAKLYIMTFKEGSIDKGRVITGSSNFTKSGLENNLEFNIELKNPGDYEFAKNKCPLFVIFKLHSGRRPRLGSIHSISACREIQRTL